MKKAKSNQAQAGTALIRPQKEVLDDDDSMVQYGGMVGDEEEDGLEHVAAISWKSNKKGTLVHHSSLIIFCFSLIYFKYSPQ